MGATRIPQAQFVLPAQPAWNGRQVWRKRGASNCCVSVVGEANIKMMGVKSIYLTIVQFKPTTPGLFYTAWWHVYIFSLSWPMRRDWYTDFSAIQRTVDICMFSSVDLPRDCVKYCGLLRCFYVAIVKSFMWSPGHDELARYRMCNILCKPRNGPGNLSRAKKWPVSVSVSLVEWMERCQHLS